jgi:nuclear receptor subfamily 2 group A
MCRFRQISPDGSECGCMKAIILFTPGNYSDLLVARLFHIFDCLETAGLCDVQPVEMLQDQAQCILGDYVRTRYPETTNKVREIASACTQLKSHSIAHC